MAYGNRHVAPTPCLMISLSLCSTLRYANRAKNIKNKPRINEDPKDAMLRQYQEEIQQLKMMLLGQMSIPQNLKSTLKISFHILNNTMGCMVPSLLTQMPLCRARKLYPLDQASYNKWALCSEPLPVVYLKSTPTLEMRTPFQKNFFAMSEIFSL